MTYSPTHPVTRSSSNSRPSTGKGLRNFVKAVDRYIAASERVNHAIKAQNEQVGRVISSAASINEAVIDHAKYTDLL